MTAAAIPRTVTSERISARAAHFAVFDAALDESIGYSLMTLFEHYSPGATDSLLIWAAQHGFAVETTVHAAPIAMTVRRVRLPHGAQIDVQENAR